MRRAPVVLAGTACGLVAVVGYHASGTRSALPNGAGLATRSGATGVHGGASSGSRTSGSLSGSTGSSPTATNPVTPALERTALGTDVSYPFGDLQVRLTMVGNRITSVAVARANVLDAQSGAIDQYVLPRLSSQALSAQSANINGISGASYTSAAYQQSLQSAIDKLKA